MTEVATLPTASPHRTSLLAKVAARFNVEPGKLMTTLKATAFKAGNNSPPATDEQMMAMMIVADQYGLNPFTKEIYAFPDKGGIVPVVGVDGWARIINEHPQFDGMTFSMDDASSACTCIIFRKDRSHEISVTEYMSECKRNTAPWGSHPKRMLRHKAMIQCARMAFGFAGIYDPDEADRIRDMGAADEVAPGTGIEAVRKAVAKAKPTKKVGEVIDGATGEITDSKSEFDYLAAAKRIESSTDREVLALYIDELSTTLPDSAEKDALMAAYRARDEALAGGA